MNVTLAPNNCVRAYHHSIEKPRQCRVASTTLQLRRALLMKRPSQTRYCRNPIRRPQAIANAGLGQRELRTLRGGLDLLAGLAHINAQVLRVMSVNGHAARRYRGYPFRAKALAGAHHRFRGDQLPERRQSRNDQRCTGQDNVSPKARMDGCFCTTPPVAIYAWSAAFTAIDDARPMKYRARWSIRVRAACSNRRPAASSHCDVIIGQKRERLSSRCG